MICRDHGQFTLIQDGIPVFSSENRVLAEESVHYLLAQVDQPRQVLVISALSGIMREIRKYPVKRIDYVELDPEVSETVFQYGLLEKNPLIHPVHMDGRAWLGSTDIMYDAVFINLPEPDTFQINRFYTREFFELARRRLSPRGGLVFSVEGYDSYLGGPELQKISILYSTVSACFRNVILIPGNRVFFICSDAPLSTDILHLLKSRGVNTWYIKNFFSGDITADRLQLLESSVNTHAPLNTDLQPRLMKIMFQQWFFKYGSSPYLFTALLLLATVLYLWRITANQFVIFSTGSMVMGCETLVIFTFQVFYGYIYFLIGILITVFLAGLLPGAIAGRRIKGERCVSVLRYTDMALMVLMAFFMAWMQWGHGVSTPIWCFLVFGFTISVLCGIQFPAVLNLQGDTDRSAAHTFSADIAGAGLGVLLVSLVLIPWGGLLSAAAALIFIKAVSMIILYRT